MRAPRVPTLETLFVAGFALLGLRLGLRPIGDNSTFVHLRTGIGIAAGDGIPRTDPYSFSAFGEPWVVQSWLASTAYGVLHRAAGFEAVVVLHGLLYAAIGWCMATLARTRGVAWRTFVAAALAIGIGVTQWSPRPLAIGLLCFALLVLTVERSWPAWVLVPTLWVWVNSHGSFVLGGVWLIAIVVCGRREARRYVPWLVAGVAVAAVNPLGVRLLTFPVTLFRRRENLDRVLEWGPPDFDGPFGILSLVAIVAGVAAIAWRRPRLSDALPALAFVGMGLLAQRNLAPAGIVMAPVLGRVLAPRADPLARDDRPRLHVALAGVIAATAAVFVAAAAASEPFDLDGYPVAAARRLPEGARVVSTDIGGCYLILAEGEPRRVFVDDRYDMYPTPVIDDYLTLYDAEGRQDPAAVLDRYRAEAVLWPRERALAATLERDDGWRRVFADDEWVVYVRS